NHDESEKIIAERVKNAAYEIIKRKHATYYGVAVAVRRICEVIVRDERSILSVSSMMHGEYGIDGICLSMPAIVGADGLETKVPISLDDEEVKALQESAKTLKEVVDSLDFSL
ncbi:MAG: L-lactate dehydrogenase, partial [Lachnospiraceae bacterium]|nr:L-lactate dehydrogenase [Lachnospiraceae bacterium]